MNKLLLRLKSLTIIITKAKFKSRKRVKFFAPTRHPKSSGNRNFAVWTLAVGFYRLRVKGDGAARVRMQRTAVGEGEGCV
jgi:hypothetical protein